MPEEMNRVFNGEAGVLVPRCCHGDVVVETVTRSIAERYSLKEPHVVSITLRCQSCGRELPAQEAPKLVRSVPILGKGKPMPLSRNPKRTRKDDIACAAPETVLTKNDC